MKKSIVTFLSICMILSCFGGCVDGGNSSPADSGSGEDDGIRYERIAEVQGKRTLATNESFTVDINEDITGQNYVKICLSTSVNLLGEFTYSNVNDPTQVATEEFFVEAAEENTEFKQFLDAFRTNGCGNFDKVMKSIKFTNKSTTSGEVTVGGVYVSDRVLPEYERELYISDGVIKVGADLATGGTLTYLERLDYNGKSVDEVIDKENNVVVGVGAKDSADCQTHLSSSVNLINIYDAGRQIQQSYYADIGGTQQATNGENGYTRAMCYTASDTGYYWPYNPVQGGDYQSNPSQIIDYHVTNDEIYIKIRAMDWAQDNSTTKSYMENWFTLKNNMVYATNRYIDWNGFYDMEDINGHNFELPATYTVHSLRNYVCYTGTKPWTNDQVLDRKPNLPSWKNGSYVSRNHPENWFAWLNDDDFGVGMYIPGDNMAYCSGRSDPSSNIEIEKNKQAYKSPIYNEYLYNKPEPTSPFCSAYTFNTNYTAPVINLKMKQYVPLTYQYVIAVDYLPVMRAQFKNVYEKEGITNESLNVWR